ncbi:LysR family transcriptional regulator [Paraburkholderia caballeronis]|uniref:LysR family transcriptional regulator n=1 Tax=Paraburkholderia caballeronis TaxID=416943 RepID=UPI001065DE37|nr:LysR substrate-binding domain-containing protein [Paraburkholderia caballeronis]TDV39277.1 LysR family transcriptional regulator [Paraburkholderia caballeronis]
MDPRKLRYFAAVADELHFGRAAQRLHIAQPPLTRQISALESELGFRLFERSTRAVTLTADGARFLPHARDLLAQLDKTTSIARQTALGNAGHVVLGYASSIALSPLFANTLRAFANDAPDVHLTLIETASASQWMQVADGRLDIGLGRMVLPDVDDIDAVTLHSERLLAALPAGDPLARQEHVTLEQLAQRPFIRYPDGYGSGVSQRIDALFGARGLDISTRYLGSQITTIVALIASGLGVSIVPDCATTMSRDGVVYRPIDADDAVIDILMLTRRGTRSAALERLCNALVANGAPTRA